MVDTDDKMANEGIENVDGKAPSYVDILPSANRHEKEKKPESEQPDADGADNKSSFVVDTVCFSIKVIAVVLSLFVLIVSILTVALPLSAMRVFNDLGMYERALNSGDRYIIGRLKDEDANTTDKNGEYTKARSKKSLADDDMLEALDVCINLSDKLMREYLGDDQKSTKHFADMLDKYIRIYFSLNGENTISQNKSNTLLESIEPVYHPVVYDYKHSLMTLDYAARVYSGDESKLQLMLYDNNGNASEDYMVEASTQSQNFVNRTFTDDGAKIRFMDWYVDYIDQLNTYLAIREEALGVTGTLTESEAIKNYTNVLKGDEFSLFVTPQDGFKRIFNDLEDSLPAFTKIAYDFRRDTKEYELHRLYWLRILTSFTDRLWNMGVLLNYSCRAYGQREKDVYEKYGSFTFHYFRNVIEGYVDGKPQYGNALSGVYRAALENYIKP